MGSCMMVVEFAQDFESICLYKCRLVYLQIDHFLLNATNVL